MSVSKTAESIFFETGKDGEKILNLRTFLLQYSPFGWIIIHRLINDRDLKILITSKGNTTGTGKTTLGIYLAREIRRWVNDLYNREGEWTAEQYAFMNEHEYIRKYLNSETGDVLLTDELEAMVDNRRSMGHGNVKFTQLWMEMRFLNCITIGTAPGLHTLDKRVPQNADIWINVIAPGKAYIYFLSTDDFDGSPIYKRLKMNGFRQTLLWLPPGEDRDYNIMKEMKKEHSKRFIDWDGEVSKQDVKKGKKEVIDSLILNVMQANEEMELGLTQEEIADKVLGGMRSQQYISKVKRENKK